MKRDAAQPLSSLSLVLSILIAKWPDGEDSTVNLHFVEATRTVNVHGHSSRQTIRVKAPHISFQYRISVNFMAVNPLVRCT